MTEYLTENVTLILHGLCHLAIEAVTATTKAPPTFQTMIKKSENSQLLVPVSLNQIFMPFPSKM